MSDARAVEKWRKKLDDMTRLRLRGVVLGVGEVEEIRVGFVVRPVYLEVRGLEDEGCVNFFLVEFSGGKLDVPVGYKGGDRVVVFCNLVGKKFLGVSGADRYVMRLRGYWMGMDRDGGVGN